MTIDGSTTVAEHHAPLRREPPRLDTLLEKVERAHGAELPAARETREVFSGLRAELAEHTVLFPRALVGGR